MPVFLKESIKNQLSSQIELHPSHDALPPSHLQTRSHPVLQKSPVFPSIHLGPGLVLSLFPDCSLCPAALGLSITFWPWMSKLFPFSQLSCLCFFSHLDMYHFLPIALTYWCFMCCYSMRLTEKWLPKDVHNLIPDNWECVTFHGKRDFANVIKLGPWDRKIIQGFLSWPNVITGDLTNGGGR